MSGSTPAQQSAVAAGIAAMPLRRGAGRHRRGLQVCAW